MNKNTMSKIKLFCKSKALKYELSTNGTSAELKFYDDCDHRKEYSVIEIWWILNEDCENNNTNNRECSVLINADKMTYPTLSSDDLLFIYNLMNGLSNTELGLYPEED